ncbi:MAG: arginine--tRNA ligase, partial [Salinimicrobium sediminis]|nr:arginine--tRNA ligase [Salinimicrobium sediminis]
MNVQETLALQVKEAVKNIFQVELESVEFQPTRKDFEGDITLVTFPMLRQIKTNPVKLGEAIGQYLVEHNREIQKFNVVQGFLNIVLDDQYYLDFFGKMKDDQNFGRTPEAEESIMVEYSSPNTNKPLHLGHIRNNLLGYSVAEILKASGK